MGNIIPAPGRACCPRQGIKAFVSWRGCCRGCVIQAATSVTSTSGRSGGGITRENRALPSPTSDSWVRDAGRFPTTAAPRWRAPRGGNIYTGGGEDEWTDKADL